MMRMNTTSTPQYLVSADSDVMVAEVFGAMTSRTDTQDAARLGERARALWLSHVAMMGWSGSPQGAPGSLWRFHEFDYRSASKSEVQAWAQVGVGLTTDGLQLDAPRPLPVAPFLVSLGDTIGRLGNWELRGVQMVLPLRWQSKECRLSWEAGKWFDEQPPGGRTTIDLLVNFGPNTSPRNLRPFDDVSNGNLECREMHFIDANPWPQSRWIREYGVPGYSQANSVGWQLNLDEWSLSAVAWLITTLVEVLIEQGVDQSVVLSVKRA